LTVGDQKYGKYNPLKPSEHRDVILQDPTFKEALDKRDPKVMEYLKFMALCHDITIDYSGEEMQYTSASPDEIAFVEFASKCGYKYHEKNSENLCTIKNTVGG